MKHMTHFEELLLICPAALARLYRSYGDQKMPCDMVEKVVRNIVIDLE